MLNRYSYCIGNPLLYVDPSGYAPKTPSSNPASPYNRIDFEARDKGVIDTLQGHQNRVEGVKDDIYNWLGESSELYNEAPADQVLNGFISAFGASFYATYDKVTHPEYFIALVYQVGTHLPEAFVNSLFSGGLPKEYLNYKNGNYRAIGEDAGYLAGNLTQAALARAAVKKCGELLDKKTGETLLPPVNEGGLDSIHNLDDLLTNPDKLSGMSGNELYDYLIKNGYDVQPLSRGSFKGIPFEEGGGFKVNWGGDRILQYHPENLSHHGGAYFKISSGETGTIRIDLDGNIIE